MGSNYNLKNRELSALAQALHLCFLIPTVFNLCKIWFPESLLLALYGQIDYGSDCFIVGISSCSYCFCTNDQKYISHGSGYINYVWSFFYFTLSNKYMDFHSRYCNMCYSISAVYILIQGGTTAFGKTYK